MTASVRPTYIHRQDWRVVAVMLSADEQVALNKLATSERREKEDMAALLIKVALEDRGLLKRENYEGEQGGKGEGGISSAPPLPFSPSPRQGETADVV